MTGYMPRSSGDLVGNASVFAYAAHSAVGQRRKYTKVHYYEHVRRVANTVRAYGHLERVVAAAYLHDVLEDTKTNHWDLRAIFPDRVVDLVVEVSDVSTASDGNRDQRKTLDRLHNAAASPEGQTIKLADLIDNAGDIQAHDPGFAYNYMAEKAMLLPLLTEGDGMLWSEARCIVRTYAMSNTAWADKYAESLDALDI